MAKRPGFCTGARQLSVELYQTLLSSSPSPVFRMGYLPPGRFRITPAPPIIKMNVKTLLSMHCIRFLFSRALHIAPACPYHSIRRRTPRKNRFPRGERYPSPSYRLVSAVPFPPLSTLPPLSAVSPPVFRAVFLFVSSISWQSPCSYVCCIDVSMAAGRLLVPCPPSRKTISHTNTRTRRCSVRRQQQQQQQQVEEKQSREMDSPRARALPARAAARRGELELGGELRTDEN